MTVKHKNMSVSKLKYRWSILIVKTHTTIYKFRDHLVPGLEKKTWKKIHDGNLRSSQTLIYYNTNTPKGFQQ